MAKIEVDPWENHTKEDLIRVVKHVERRMEALRGRLAACEKQNEQMTRQWAVLLERINPSTPMPWERYRAMFDLLLEVDTAIREEIGIPGEKYGIGNCVYENPDWRLPKAWLAVLEFLDMDDE